jgi:hypothetical protein
VIWRSIGLIACGAVEIETANEIKRRFQLADEKHARLFDESLRIAA